MWKERMRLEMPSRIVFFPENRRQYSKSKRVVYRDLNIFSVDGIKKFEEDTQVVIDYLVDRAFG
jgi:hypothetical protein